MNDFKIGDWVIIIDGSDLKEESIHKLDDEKLYLVKQLYKDSVKLWQPKEGEWCWYKHCLVKVLSIRDTSYQVSAPMFGEQWTGSIELEPFTNQLPTYIKDK